MQERAPVRLWTGWLPIHRMAAIAIVGVVSVGVAAAFWWPSHRSSRPLVVGFQKSPPYHFPDANGNPTGPSVDVVREAARRTNIALEWRYSPEGPEKALSTGAADLW